MPESPIFSLTNQLETITTHRSAPGSSHFDRDITFEDNSKAIQLEFDTSGEVYIGRGLQTDEIQIVLPNASYRFVKELNFEYDATGLYTKPAQIVTKTGEASYKFRLAVSSTAPLGG